MDLYNLQCNLYVHWYSKATMDCTVANAGFEQVGSYLGVRGNFLPYSV